MSYMRERTSGTIPVLSTLQKAGYKKQSSTVYLPYAQSAQNFEHKWCQDVVTPNYKRLVAEGNILNNPFASIKTTCIATPKPSGGSVPDTWNDPVGWEYGFYVEDVIGFRWGGAPLRTDLIPNEDPTKIALAATSAYAGVASSDSMALVSLGEMNETLTLLHEMLQLLKGRASPFIKNFEKLQKSLGKGHYTRARSEFLEELANLWLKYRYGVMPLIYDIEGVLKALDASARGSWRRTSRASDEYSDSGTVTNTKSSGTLNSINLSLDWEWGQKYSAGVLYDSVLDLQSQLGLRISDIPNALWELTRLSFVADWFANTGDYIAALTSVAKGQDLAAWHTVRTTALQTYTYQESGPVTWTRTTPPTSRTFQHTNNGSGASVSWVYSKTTRQPMSRAAIEWSVKFSPTKKRVFDALALLHNAFGGSVRSRTLRL